ncbi:hypothetical protein SAMN04488030_0801 [Aliiroseovarius halocynthiae]|nr:hypothetical protein SAMN04488030_0801 [Aliiroseovarius halocynthiae]
MEQVFRSKHVRHVYSETLLGKGGLWGRALDLVFNVGWREAKKKAGQSPAKSNREVKTD